MRAKNNGTVISWRRRSNEWRRATAVFVGIFLIGVWASLSVFSQVGYADDSPQPRLPTIQLQIANKILTAEVAASGQERYMGLSFRPSLAKDEGMLFVYPAEENLIFTMRNTLIPLSIAFISKDLVINEIHHMNVGPGQRFPAKQKAQFALEVNQGWFAANDISVGDQIIKR